MMYKPRGHQSPGKPLAKLLDGAETGLQTGLIHVMMIMIMNLKNEIYVMAKFFNGIHK